MPKVSIVIRSYNEERHIGRLLHGIREQNFCDFETIVVDSGSTDKTVAIAESYGATIVHIPKAEFSFGRALNVGCSAARGELLVFASAHVYPLQANWLEKLLDPFSDSRVCLSYGRQVGNEFTKFSEHEVFRAWFPMQSIPKQTSNFCNNANCAIRRRNWLSLKYDETLTGLEDIAWAKEVRKMGGDISYVAEAPVAHVHEESWTRIRDRYRREALALRLIEPSLHFGFADFLALAAKNICSDMGSASQFKLLLREAKGIVMFRFNQFFGTWLAYRENGQIDANLRIRFYYPPENIQKNITKQPTAKAINYEGVFDASPK